MAKYVCDFEAVKTAGEKLCQAASDIDSAVNTYATTIEKDLSSWDGMAKKSFEASHAKQVENTKTDVKYINALGEFVKSCSESIEALEEELAGLSI